MNLALPLFRLLLGAAERPSSLAAAPEGAAVPDHERAERNLALVRRITLGDRDALAELYDRLSRPLFSTSLHILADATEAQDVVHDVFLTLWEKAATFDPARGSVFSWAVTLTRNRSIDRLRLRANRARLLEGSVPDDLGYGAGREEVGADDRADLRDRAEAVRRALSTLPSDQQKALQMAFFSGLTQKEIAEALSEPVGTIKARIRRGLIRLRETLSRRL